jgi:hypothetical protein
LEGAWSTAYVGIDCGEAKICCGAAKTVGTDWYEGIATGTILGGAAQGCCGAAYGCCGAAYGACGVA